MTSTREEEKPWKTDLARRSALRREQVLREVEEAVRHPSPFKPRLPHAVALITRPSPPPAAPGPPRAPRGRGIGRRGVLPLEAVGGVELASVEANLESYAREDLGGYVAGGSNGEAVFLEEGEKLALIRTTRRPARTRLLL